jgi:preprotein translocase subunit YajC
MESLGGLLFPLLILLLFIPIFLSGRKQRRQMQTMQQLQSSLEIGDVVTTTSGLRGTVVDVSYEDTVDLEIADDVVTTWMRAAVRDKVADTATDTVTDPALGHASDPAVDRTPDDAAVLAPEASGTGSSTTPVVDGDLDRDRTVAPAERPSDANGTPRP